ncbi:MAG: DUF4430 domain-containing protein [Erysipelotrichaceae bacterium]
MKKRIISIGALLLLLVGVVWGVNTFMPKAEKGAKEITLIVVDEMNDNEILLEKVFHTDAETLEQFLQEKTELNAVMEAGSFGTFLKGMLGKVSEDMNAGPWWLYESANNTMCQEAGYCPGVSEMLIYDQDEFTFKWTNRFE